MNHNMPQLTVVDIMKARKYPRVFSSLSDVVTPSITIHQLAPTIISNRVTIQIHYIGQNIL